MEDYKCEAWPDAGVHGASVTCTLGSPVEEFVNWRCGCWDVKHLDRFTPGDMVPPCGSNPSCVWAKDSLMIQPKCSHLSAT